VEPDVVMSRGPIDVEIDVDLREIAAGRERRGVAAPVSIWPCAILLGRSETRISTQPGVPLAGSGVNSAGIAASVRVSGWLTSNVAIVSIRQVEPPVGIFFKAIEVGSGGS